MALVKENPKVDGNIWWSGLGFGGQPKLMDSLSSNYQRYPALMPKYEHIDTIPPFSSCKYKI